ncbi:MAG TPA: hypothetical protein VGB91_04445, partial [Rhizomicrobium sp.]
GGSSFLGLGPTKPRGYAPAAGEDCTPFNPEQTRVANTDGTWRLGDFAHHLANFQADRENALRAMALIGYYHFDEECFVTRETPAMLYWKRAGLIPKEGRPGEACIPIDPAAVKAEIRDGEWSVVAGFAILLDFGDDKTAAEHAVSVIRTYKLNRQCFAGPVTTALQYWLSQ